jgi:hypothetical protein
LLLIVVNWSNYYYNLPTALPFVAFGFLFEAFIFLWFSPKRPTNAFTSWAKNTCSSIVIVCLAEGGQFFIVCVGTHMKWMSYLLLGEAKLAFSFSTL